jgi:hypothetical protein
MTTTIFEDALALSRKQLDNYKEQIMTTFKIPKPVAWLHELPGRFEAIHTKVKDLWAKVGTPNQFAVEKLPVRVEHYTIPLFTSEQLLAAYEEGKSVQQDNHLAILKTYRMALVESATRVEVLTDALEEIADWKLPPTGEFWDGDPARPVSFETNFGSQGAKAHIRNVATLALATVKELK